MFFWGEDRVSVGLRDSLNQPQRARAPLLILTPLHCHLNNMHIVHYSDQINHLNGRYSAQASSSSVTHGGEMLTLSPESRGEIRGGPLICVILPPDVSIKRRRGDIHYTTKAQQHSEQDLPRGFTLSPTLELHWYLACRDIKEHSFCDD